MKFVSAKFWCQNRSHFNSYAYSSRFVFTLFIYIRLEGRTQQRALIALETNKNLALSLDDVRVTHYVVTFRRL